VNKKEKKNLRLGLIVVLTLSFFSAGCKKGGGQAAAAAPGAAGASGTSGAPPAKSGKADRPTNKSGIAYPVRSPAGRGQVARLLRLPPWLDRGLREGPGDSPCSRRRGPRALCRGESGQRGPGPRRD